TGIRRDSPERTFVKPEAARSLFPRLIDRNHHFRRLLSEPGLTPLRISTRRRISSVSCASEAFLGGRRTVNASTCGRRGCAVCYLLRSHSDSCLLPRPPHRKKSHSRPGKGPAAHLRAAIEGIEAGRWILY